MKFSFAKLLPSLIRQSVKQQTSATMTVNDKRFLEICALPAENSLAELETSKDGLRGADTDMRREEYGFLYDCFALKR